MRAKCKSTCYVCAKTVLPGDEIVHIADIGWCHTECSVGLDAPVVLSDFTKRLWGPNIKTRRELSIVRRELADAENSYPFGDPVDIEDLIF